MKKKGDNKNMSNKEILEAIIDLKGKIGKAEKLVLKIRESIKGSYINWSKPHGNNLLDIRTCLMQANNLTSQVEKRLIKSLKN